MKVINHIAIKILKSVGEESGKTSMDCLVKETLLECQKLGLTPDLKNVKSSVKNVMRFLFKCSVSALGEKFTEISKAKVSTKSKKNSLKGKNRSFEDIKNYCDQRTNSNALIVSITTECFKSFVNDNLLLESHDLNSCDFSHCLGACLVGETSFIVIECNYLNSDAVDRLKGILSNVKTLFDSRVWVVLATSSSLNPELLPFIEKQFAGRDRSLAKSIPEKNDAFSKVCYSANTSHDKTSNQRRASEYDFEMNEIERRLNESNEVSEISELKEQVLKLKEIIISKDRDIEVYASRLTDKEKKLHEKLCETKNRLGNASSVQIVVDSIPKLHYKTDVSKTEDKISAKIKILRGELIQDHSDFHEFTGIGNTLKHAKNDAFNTFMNNIESYVSNMKS